MDDSFLREEDPAMEDRMGRMMKEKRLEGMTGCGRCRKSERNQPQAR